MNKVLFYTTNFMLCGIAIFGITLASITLAHRDEFHKSIVLKMDNETNYSWNVNINGLYPGKSICYDVEFKNTLNDTLNVALDFKENGDITLSNYLDLEIIYNNQEIIKKDNFNSFFNGEIVSFKSTNFDNVITFRYTMPQNIENEAQKTYADFVVDINIESEVIG